MATPLNPDLPSILQAFGRIKLLAMDVDGVLTRGDIIYTESGEELKIFNVKDGQGLSLLTQAQFPVAWITARKSAIVERRGKELGIPYVFQAAKPKLPKLEALAQQLGLTLDQVAYIGDDIPDMPILQCVGLALCPADAVEWVKQVCHYSTNAPGGMGAVREIIDLLLHVNGLSPTIERLVRR